MAKIISSAIVLVAKLHPAAMPGRKNRSAGLQPAYGVLYSKERQVLHRVESRLQAGAPAVVSCCAPSSVSCSSSSSMFYFEDENEDEDEIITVPASRRPHS